jgi:hypothetical protein
VKHTFPFLNIRIFIGRSFENSYCTNVSIHSSSKIWMPQPLRVKYMIKPPALALGGFIIKTKLCYGHEF